MGVGGGWLHLFPARTRWNHPLRHNQAESFCPLAQFLVTAYVTGVTQAVAQILDEFERLSEKKRQELRRVIVERIPLSDDLTDDDFAALAAASFRALDEEEKTPRA